MIERIFPIDNATIEVTFQWDSGGPGITPSWDGEETGVCVKAGAIWTFIAFEVEEVTAPEMWRVREVQVNEARVGADGRTERLHALSLVQYEGDGRPRLGDFPTVCAAVSETWVQEQAREAIDGATENVWEHEQLVAEMEREVEETGDGHHRVVAAHFLLKQATAERDRLKALYEERYEHLPEYISVDRLHVDPEYHRGQIAARREIFPLIVNRRSDGRYFIIDGVRRLNAALQMGHPRSVPCRVQHMAVIEEAAEFIRLNSHRTSLSQKGSS